MYYIKLNPLLNLRKIILRGLNVLALVLSVVGLMQLVYRFGFPLAESETVQMNSIARIILIALWVTITMRYLLVEISSLGSMPSGRGGRSRAVFTISGYIALSVIVVLMVCVSYDILKLDWFLSAATGDATIAVMMFLVGVTEISKAITGILSSRGNPSTILAMSFLLIIIIGSFLLMLPNCTTDGIRYIDSLFISASAVCVTGLSPLDIPSTLTTEGMLILLLLIQIGGLGIMTITSFFGLFFMNGGSLSNQLMVRDLLSGDNINGLLRTLGKIVVVTILIEAMGAMLLYVSIVGHEGFEGSKGVIFAIFHSVSAFCNAGFSTLSANLYDPVVRNLSGVIWVISWLVVLGGIGFPIFANFLSYANHHLRNIFRRMYGIRTVRKPHLINLNTYIVLRTTLFLLVVSWGLFLAMEWNNSLAQYSIGDKLSQGFLMAVTPRTAGFNGVDVNAMLPASLLLTIVLMWIGGAPQSTAGGIKVTSLYLAVKNIQCTATGSEYIQVQHRRIPQHSLRRVSAIILLSIGVLFVAVILLSILEPDIDIFRLTFEAVSAMGTVGLSINVTPKLGDAAKLIVIALMFIGRIGLLSLLAALVRAKKHQNYIYPQEDILIT